MKFLSVFLLILLTGASLYAKPRTVPPPNNQPRGCVRPKELPFFTTERGRTLVLMESIVVDKIDFHNADLTNVVNFLRDYSIRNDRSDSAVKGINVLIGSELLSRTPVPKVSLDLHSVTLEVAFRHLATFLNVPYSVRGNTVVIGTPDTELITRAYDVLPHIISDWARVSNGRPLSEVAKEQFTRAGVLFDNGASIHVLPDSGKLIVRNTETNLSIFEKILAWTNIVPSILDIDFRLVEVMDNRILSSNLVLTIEKENELLADGKLRLLMDLDTIARTGVTVSNQFNTIRNSSLKSEKTSGVECWVVTDGLVSPDGVIIDLNVDIHIRVVGTEELTYESSNSLCLWKQASAILWMTTGSGKSLMHHYLRITPSQIDPEGCVLQDYRETFVVPVLSAEPSTKAP